MSLKQKLIAVAFVLLLGALSGLFYPFVQGKRDVKRKRKIWKTIGGFRLYLRDFLFFTFVGILYLLLMFVFYDFNFRIYPLVLFAASYFFVFALF